MPQPTPLSRLESKVEALIGRAERLAHSVESLEVRLAAADRENRRLRAERKRIEGRSAKAKSALEAVLNQLPQG